MAFAIFSVTELIYDKSIKGSFLRKIRTRGRWLIMFALLSIGFNFYRDWKSEGRQDESNKAKAKVDSLLQDSQTKILQLQASVKDTIIKEVKNTYSNSIKASNEALAKYNLIITDSLHSVVSKLKLDASNPQLIVSPLEKGSQPVFISKENDKNILNIQFVSKGGTSNHVTLKCYILENSSHGYIVLQTRQFAQGESSITEGVLSTRKIELLPEVLLHSEVIIFLTGSFTKDSQGTIIVPFNDALSFNLKDNKYIAALEMDFKSLKQYLDIKEIINEK
jgi:hypothetical protein